MCIHEQLARQSWNRFMTQGRQCSLQPHRLFKRKPKRQTQKTYHWVVDQMSSSDPQNNIGYCHCPWLPRTVLLKASIFLNKLFQDSFDFSFLKLFILDTSAYCISKYIPLVLSALIFLALTGAYLCNSL